MNSLRRFGIAALLVSVMVLAAGNVGAQGGQTPEEICAAADIQEPETREFAEAEDVLQEGIDYWAVMCTSKGPVYIDLLEEEAPLTVNNFVFLAQQGYYNNTTFHRVLPGFMAQGGDPTGTGGGGPGYEFEDETSNGLVFDHPGLLAMANAGPGTNGSQFFITYAPTDWLNGAHTIFGSVYQGMDVAELLRPRDPDQAPDFEGDALQTVVIIEDSSTVNASPDEPPTIEHIQAVLESAVASQISRQFTFQEDFSHVYDLDAEAESWADQGGDAMVSLMRDYLTQKEFKGTAAVLLVLAECPENAADSPIWAISMQVSEYGVPAEEVVFDDERANMMVEQGAFETFENPEGLMGRLFRLPAAEDWCSETGQYYRYEVPQGRYVLTVDLVVDGSVVSDTGEATGAQVADFVMQSLLQGSISGVLERGNAAE